jgi:hypothetical protein
MRRVQSNHDSDICPYRVPTTVASFDDIFDDELAVKMTTSSFHSFCPWKAKKQAQRIRKMLARLIRLEY